MPKKKKKQILALYPNRKKGILSEPQGGCYGSVFSAEKQKVCLMICFPYHLATLANICTFHWRWPTWEICSREWSQPVLPALRAHCCGLDGEMGSCHKTYSTGNFFSSGHSVAASTHIIPCAFSGATKNPLTINPNVQIFSNILSKTVMNFYNKAAEIKQMKTCLEFLWLQPVNLFHHYGVTKTNILYGICTSQK